MKNTLKTLTLLLLLLPTVAFATPVSWDFTNSILQPLRSGWSAQIMGNFFTATSTVNHSTFPYASSTASSFGTICLTSDTCRTTWPAGTVYTATWPITLSGSAFGFNGLSTSSPAVIGNIPYFSGVNTFANVATTTASCSGSVACSAFTIIGSSPITLTGNGLTSYDAFTHPSLGVSATTSQLNMANLLVTGSSTLQNFTAVNSTSTNATTTSLSTTNLAISGLSNMRFLYTNAGIVSGVRLDSAPPGYSYLTSNGTADGVTLSNIQGTTNQIIISHSNGFTGGQYTTLSTPQNIDTGATPTFAGILATASTTLQNFTAQNATTSSLYVSGSVGIGTSTPISGIELAGNAPGPATFTENAYVTGAGSTGGISMKRADGTPSAPTQALSGDALGVILGVGYTSAGQFGSNVVAIKYLAAENFTSTNQGTKITFATTPIGTASRVDRLTLDGLGYLGLGTTSPRSLLQIVNSGAASTTLTDTSAANGERNWSLQSLGGVFTIATSTDVGATSTQSAVTINKNGQVTANCFNNTVGGTCLSSGGTSFTWNDTTGSTQTIIVNNGYISDDGATKITFTLPATCTLGNTFQVVGKGSGKWQINQGVSQIMHLGIVDTTTGSSGAASSTAQYDSVTMVCTTTNNEWTMTSSVGNFNTI